MASPPVYPPGMDWPCLMIGGRVAEFEAKRMAGAGAASRCPGETVCSKDRGFPSVQPRPHSRAPTSHRPPSSPLVTRASFLLSVAAFLEFAGHSVDLDLVADFDEGGELEFVLRVLQCCCLGDLA